MPANTQSTTTYLTPADLAERWCCAVGSLANQRSAGEGPKYVKIGSRVLYRLADVEAFEDARLVEPVREVVA